MCIQPDPDVGLKISHDEESWLGEEETMKEINDNGKKYKNNRF